MSYEAQFSDLLSRIDAALADFLMLEYRRNPASRAEEDGVARLWEALRYSVLAGGKRIRPLLCLEACRAFGGSVENALPTACAVEAIHAFSLIHDDLPCMDDDDLRRGQPTLHRAFDEATALLAGDALIAAAFGWIIRQTPRQSGVDAETLLAILSDLSDAAGLQGLIPGQYADMVAMGHPVSASANTLDYIHQHKTGALITFSLKAGARLGGATEERLSEAERLGVSMGLMFQIVDDLLDIQATSEALGKTAGKDIAQGKLTYPAVYGLEASRRRVDSLAEAAGDLLRGWAGHGVRTEGLMAICRFFQTRLH
jgi:geranylgeranyl diphosphate synthase type II